MCASASRPCSGTQEGRSLPCVWSTSKLFRRMGGEGKFSSSFMNKEREAGGGVSGPGVGKQWGVSVHPTKVMWKRAVLCRKQFPGIQKGGEVFCQHSSPPSEARVAEAQGSSLPESRLPSVESGQEGQDHGRDGGKACRHHLEAEPPVRGGSTIPPTLLHSTEGGKSSPLPFVRLLRLPDTLAAACPPRQPQGQQRPRLYVLFSYQLAEISFIRKMKFSRIYIFTP